MNNFIFYNPVKMLFGVGMTSKLSELIPSNARVLILYGGGSAKINGSLEQAKSALGKRKYVEFSGIEPNPEYETCLKAVDKLKKHKLNFILAIGGGSVIDAAKFISAAAKYKGKSPWNIVAKQAPIKEAIPIATIVTLPATCSEMNMWAVISRRKLNTKLGFYSEAIAPKFSVLDPSFTLTLPAKQTRNGVIDAIIHVLEQYLTRPADAPFQDRYSEGLIMTLIKNGLKVMGDEKNIKYRANIMLCAAMAHNGVPGMGVPQDWSSHVIGHQLTALYGIDHGESLSIVMPKLLSYKFDKKQEKLCQLGNRVFGIEGKSKRETAKKTIIKLKEFFKKMGAPVELKDCKLPDSAPRDAALLFDKIIGSAGEDNDIRMEDVEKILKI